MTTETTTLVCPQCWGKLTDGQVKCWLCGQDLTTELGAPVVTSETVSPGPDRFSFSLGSTMLLLTLASVVFGIVAVNPGLGIWVCILSVPVLVRTIMVVRAREAQGKQVETAEKVGFFVTSLGVASVVSVVVCAAAFASFCSVCLLVVSVNEEYGLATLAWAIGIGLIALVPISFSKRMFKWIHNRYRRDIERE